VDRELITLSSLMASSAQPSASQLVELSRFHKNGDLFKNCCLRAVTCAQNPFIPGITLSIRLVEAAKQASEGERRAITDIKLSIDELLLEIFERLPQTVRGFTGGLKGCENIFEPKSMASSRESKDLGGPLDMIVSEPLQLETFCKAPLFVDFLSSKFTLGLPDLNDTRGVLRNRELLGGLKASGLALQGGGGWLLQGAVGLFSEDTPSLTFLPGAVGLFLEDMPSLTFLPGAQFIVAGIVAAPTKYYEVPAVRMLLDFVVYVGMVAALSYFVFFHTTTGDVAGDDGIVDHTFSFSERACALIFVTAGVYREGCEMRRDVRRYFHDQWNVL
ncbi:unnamed protein product, partial [Hapterophycus canaliculatus]